MAKNGLGTRIFKSIFSWLGDKFIEHWPVLFAVFVGGGGMSYLASITHWISAYGPAAWGGVGILTILILSFTYFLYANARMKLSSAEYQRRKGEIYGTNVLSPVHENERISLADFYHPFFRPTENARFENCDLMGPALVAVNGCNFLHGSFIDCEIVIAREDRPVKGAMMFGFCTFLRCRLYRVTFIVNIKQYRNFPADMRAGVPVISDGRIGDI
jgi:hypothetical protein